MRNDFIVALNFALNYQFEKVLSTILVIALEIQLLRHLEKKIGSCFLVKAGNEPA